MDASEHDPLPPIVALSFEGPSNLRDLGGFRTADGRFVRRNLVYRADSLSLLTEADHLVFAALGVRTVYDLRDDRERTEAPNPFSAIDIDLRITSKLTPLDRIADGNMLAPVYTAMLTDAAAEIGRLLRHLASRDAVPAVIHCTAGKDRTGVVVAALLSLLGVSRATVLHDYAASESLRRAEQREASYERMVANGMSPAAAAGVLGSPPQAMADALDAVDRRFGGFDRYLSEACGVDAATTETLRRALLEADRAADGTD